MTIWDGCTVADQRNSLESVQTPNGAELTHSDPQMRSRDARAGDLFLVNQPRAHTLWSRAGMAFNYIPDALDSLQRSTAVLSGASFNATRSLTRAVLASEDEFETLLIRDAAPYELALFMPTAETRLDSAPLVDVDLSRIGDERWTATKRQAPRRATTAATAKPSPLKLKRGTAKAAEDPTRCLTAARKLLEVYPMTRASEHVQALSEQYEGILSSINDLEETLKQPISRVDLKPHQQEHFKALDLEEQIKKEQMEIFALEQLQVERQAEIDALSARPRPRKAPPVTNTLSEDQVNPFAKSTLLESKHNAPQARMAAQSKARQSLSASSPRRTSQSPQTTPRTSRSTSARPSPASSATTAPSPRDKPRTPRQEPPPASADSTPKAARQSPAKASAPLAVSAGTKAAPARKVAKAHGATEADLDLFARRVWFGMGDALRPWARKTLSAAGQDAPAPLQSLPFEPTLSTLQTVLSAPATPVGPSSPQSIVSSSLTSDVGDDCDPLPPSPSALLEYQLLNLLLSVISGRTPTVPAGTDLTPLGVTLRDPVLASSLATNGTTSLPTSPSARTPGKKDPMVSMNLLKAWLAHFARSKGLGEDMGTTAIYALVSKNVLRIDRRGKEGPMVGFRY
ncbi:hypothetical protein OIV83_004394 [Microbotryomycetes sp. JL201]|nr:hypothetical protein OIV83_004394 [Microbotryomycetes sp. JL201]